MYIHTHIKISYKYNIINTNKKILTFIDRTNWFAAIQ